MENSLPLSANSRTTKMRAYFFDLTSTRCDESRNRFDEPGKRTTRGAPQIEPSLSRWESSGNRIQPRVVRRSEVRRSRAGPASGMGKSRVRTSVLKVLGSVHSRVIILSLSLSLYLSVDLCLPPPPSSSLAPSIFMYMEEEEIIGLSRIMGIQLHVKTRWSSYTGLYSGHPTRGCTRG